jgi:hypothetical protein
MAILDELKSFNVADANVSLWVFKGPRGSVDTPPIYTGRWVEITESVANALKETVINERQRIEEVLEYDLLSRFRRTPPTQESSRSLSQPKQARKGYLSRSNF